MMSTSKKMLLALVALIVSIVYIALTFRFRKELGWWVYSDCFALFMAVFTWLMSLVIAKMIPHSGKVLSKISLVFGIIFVIAFIMEYLFYTISF